jgi:type III secretion protein D
MKQIRILTGAHAGARLDLAPGDYRIGTDPGADLQLLDWPGAEARLQVDADGAVRIEQPPGEQVWLVDHVPMPFGKIALCMGDSDGPWPDDLALLSTLYLKPEPTAAQRRRKAVGTALACLMLGSLVVAGGALLLPGQTHAAAVPDLHAQRHALESALAAAHLDGLRVSDDGATLHLSGLVTTAAEDLQLRNLLAHLQLGRVERAYDVAQNDARGIEDALGVAGARVRYAGHGEFEVGGVVRSREQLEAAISRVRPDLDANVKAIRLAADLAYSDTLPGEFSEVMSADDITYGQTPDGVKHLYLPPQQQ